MINTLLSISIKGTSGKRNRVLFAIFQLYNVFSKNPFKTKIDSKKFFRMHWKSAVKSEIKRMKQFFSWISSITAHYNNDAFPYKLSKNIQNSIQRFLVLNFSFKLINNTKHLSLLSYSIYILIFNEFNKKINLKVLIINNVIFICFLSIAHKNSKEFKFFFF